MMFQFFYVYIYVYLNVTEIANKKNWACQNACKRGKMRSEFEGFFSFIYDGDGHNRHIYCLYE